MKFLIINGPNLNLLGRREPGIYGQENYDSLCADLREFAAARGSTAECFQSNHEGRMELFDGLALGEYEKEWVKRPVLHFDSCRRLRCCWYR